MKIFLTGGCMIWGYKLRRKWFLPTLVEKELGLPILYHSKSFNLDELFESLKRDIENIQPSDVVIQFLNDQMFDDTVKGVYKYEEKLGKCLDLINCRKYLMTPVPPTATIFNSQYSTEVNEMIPDALNYHYSVILDAVSDHNSEIIDLWDALIDKDPKIIYQKDGYHLTDAGQEIAAKEISKTLSNSSSVVI